MTEADKAVKGVEHVRTDYRRKVAECADQFMRERVSEWVMDSCDRIAKEAREQAQALLTNALKNKQASTKSIISNGSLYNPRA